MKIKLIVFHSTFILNFGATLKNDVKKILYIYYRTDIRGIIAPPPPKLC